MTNQPRQELLISHLDDHVLSGPVGAVAQPGHWRAIPYEAEGFDGMMLGCGEATSPGPIRLRLGATGVHRVWLGLYAWRTGTIRVRLTDDLCCTRMSTPAHGVLEPTVLHEVEWKTCDLDGQDLWLEGAFDRQPLAGALAYVRLEPLDQKPADLPAVGSASESWRGMCITNDGCGVFRQAPHHRPEDLLETLESIPDSSCMRSLVWGNGNADSCNYPTKVGNPLFLQQWQDPHVAGDGAIGLPNARQWQEPGWDSLRLVRDYTRKRAWELHVYIRMEAFAGSYPHEELVWSRFFYDHPQWWCLDRNGHPVNRLSYAVPEVQDHMLDLMAEISTYDPDGISLCLVRGIPLVLYEPVMVAGFQQQHGVDPRTLDELDPRWLDYQAEIFTAFVRRVRDRLPEHQRLSVMVPGNEAECRRWGLDVATWVREGLVDDLYPVGQRFNVTHTHYDAPEAVDLSYFQALEGRGSIRLIPCFYTWTLYREDPVAFRQLVRSLLEQGADQYCIWDGDASYDDAKVGDIGNENWDGPAYTPVTPPAARTVNLYSLNGFHIHEYGSCEVV
ncbi:MAG: hypothetical protein HN712_14955 [Gemmatimonadetes bacterium]|nr:hypothetical protein [Gemmatimonadota bacterium]MBT6148931.1 hypothetical protein [Gemmatimonadota bacterium]MBT7861618.1 hypothetical protein [Gemmatimonadota bacterium]